MARKAAWESASDLGPYAKSGGTNWGRVFVLVLLVGAGTFVAAYYLPLYRAQQKLSADYHELGQKSQTLTDSLTKTQSELKSVSQERDELRSEHDQRESAKKAASGKLDQARTDESTKLDKLIKKGSAVVAPSANGNALLVALDVSALFLPLKLELSPAGKQLACDIAKSAHGEPIEVSGELAADATLPAAFEGSFGNPWALSAARAAAVVAALEEKCALPATQLRAVADGKRDPFSAQLTALKAPERVVFQLGAR